MTHGNQVTVEPGMLFQIDGQPKALTRIGQVRYDSFRLIFDGEDFTVLVDTRGLNRTEHEGARARVEGLRLQEGDLVTLPGRAARLLSGVSRIREGRYQLRLDEKYADPVTVDVIAGQ